MEKNIWLEFHHVKEFCNKFGNFEIELVGLSDSLSEIISDNYELEFGYEPSPFVVTFIKNQVASINERWAADRELDRQIAEIADEMQREERVRRATERIVSVP